MKQLWHNDPVALFTGESPFLGWQLNEMLKLYGFKHWYLGGVSAVKVELQEGNSGNSPRKTQKVWQSLLSCDWTVWKIQVKKPFSKRQIPSMRLKSMVRESTPLILSQINKPLLQQ